MLETTLRIIGVIVGVLLVLAAPIMATAAFFKGAKKAGVELSDYSGASAILGVLLSLPAGITGWLIGSWQASTLLGFATFAVGIIITTVFVYWIMSHVEVEE